MARLKHKILTLGLAGLLALPLAGHAQSAPDYTSPTPMGMNIPDITSMLPGQMANLNGLQALTAMGGMGNMDLGTVLMNSVVNATVSTLTTQLLGQIGGMGGGMMSGMMGGIGQAVMGQMLGQALGQQMAMYGLSGFATGGLTTNLGGMQNVLPGGIGNFGGLGGDLMGSVVNGVVNNVVQTGMQQLLGGVEGSSGGGTSFGGFDSDDVLGELASNLSLTAAIDANSDNYRQGVLDAVLGKMPDTGYAMMEGWDSNYWAGYEAARDGTAAAATQ